MNKHECLVNSDTATGDDMRLCYLTKVHMREYARGQWCLQRPDGTRVLAKGRT